MRFSGRVLPMLLLAVWPGAASSAETASIPPQFLGEWRANLKACGAEFDDSRLTISAHKLSFYESGGTVRAVAIHDPLAVTVRSAFSGEGETWEATDQLVLSKSQDALTVKREDTSFTRKRCPAKKR